MKWLRNRLRDWLGISAIHHALREQMEITAQHMEISQHIVEKLTSTEERDKIATP